MANNFMVAVELAPVYIEGFIQAVTKPSRIQWLLNGKPIDKPSFSIGQISEIIYSVQLFRIFEPDEETSVELMGDYSLKVFW